MQEQKSVIRLDEHALHRITTERVYGMSIITTRADDEMSGCLIGFMTQCSIHPVHWMVCLSEKNHTFGVAQRASALAVHFLDQSELHLAELFGHETGDRVNKFEMCSWEEGPFGVPLLKQCKRKIVGKVIAKVPAGDHTGFLIDSQFAQSPDGKWDMLYMDDCKHIVPGHPA